MTARVVNIRGTSGSGKTTLIRLFRDHVGGWAPVGGNAKRPDGYRCADGTMVVGPYENVSGGCDCIKTQDEIGARVRAFVQAAPRVLLEGLLMSHLSSRYAALSGELASSGFADGITFAFLDTPLAECLARIQARRDARGDTRPFNPANTASKVTSIRQSANNLRAAGCRVVVLNWQAPLPDLLELLGYQRDLAAVTRPTLVPSAPRPVGDALSLGL